MARLNGYAIGAVSIGAIMVYAGITGRSVLTTIQAIIQGKAPKTAAKDQPIVSTPPDTTTSGASSGSTFSATPPSSAGKAAWIKSFLSALGAPQTAANVNSVSSWISHETPWPPVAANNPLNTTYSLGGATNYNSVGVKNYPDAATGLNATIATLQSGAYSDIVSLLRSGQGLCGHSLSGLSTWSGGGYSQVC